MVGTKAYVTYLAQVPLFSACSKKELQKIDNASVEMTVEAGRVLMEEKTIGREAFVVTEGRATITRSNRKVATIGPGDHVGELALLDGGPRTATVVADTPMKLLVIDQRAFAVLLEEVPGLARKMLATLAGQVRTLDKKVYT